MLMPKRNTYDLMLGLSTYKSVASCERFLRSVDRLQCHVIATIVSPNRAELDKLVPVASCVDATVLLFHQQQMNNAFMGRNWGFVWACNNGVEAEYLGSCDDDIEFVDEARGIVPIMSISRKRFDWCMMGFESSHPYKYEDQGAPNDENFRVGLDWLDGNLMLTKWTDNLRCGVIDGPADFPIAFYVEGEYAHRFRYLTGKPVCLRTGDTYYLHHMRQDPAVVCERQGAWRRREFEAERFWRSKFGIDAELKGVNHKDLYDKEASNHFEILKYVGFRQHVMFGGLWTEWTTIYERYESKHELVYVNR